MQVLLTLAAQLAAALLVAPWVVAYVPMGRAFHLGYAVLIGVLVWLAGVIVARIMGSGRVPGVGTLVAAIVGALVGVAIIMLPMALPGFTGMVRTLADPVYIMAGAIVGYWVLR